MTDFSMPNAEPGECCKCRGTGVYEWGTSLNGKRTNSGPCHSCAGTGRQTRSDIARNECYNRHKIIDLGD